MKYVGAFFKGSNYNRALTEKMKSVENSSKSMNDEADLNQHMRLEQVGRNAKQSNHCFHNVLCHIF